MLRVAVILTLALVAIASPQSWRDRDRSQPQTYRDRSLAQTQIFERPQYQYSAREFQTQHKPQTFEFTNRRAKTHQGPIDREEVVIPEEYREAHNAFSLEVLRNQYYAQTVEKHGAVSISPFSFAHFLAIIQEKNFDIPIENIPKILNLPVQQIPESLGLINEAHKDDHKAYLTSQFYTSNQQLELTPGQIRLDVHKQNLIFADQAPSLINSHIRVATHDIINEALIPNVPAFNKETTKGIFLNTFHYRNYFEHEFLKVGKKSFQAPSSRPVDIETLETIGTFPVYENDMFAAVALPLESEGEDKHVVFVLPKNSLKQYLGSAALDHVFKSAPTTWVKKTIRVQLPHINVTMAHNVEQYIKNENIVCSRDRVDQIHPIVQVTNFFIDNEEISYAVATGAQVTINKHYRHNIPRTQHQRGHTFSSNTNQYKLNALIPTADNTLYYSSELILNKPFFTYFYDTTYGPFGYTAISHVFQQEAQTNLARHHESPFDFSEETKHARFTCEGQH